MLVPAGLGRDGRLGAATVRLLYQAPTSIDGLPELP
jgi:hypothetical protein